MVLIKFGFSSKGVSLIMANLKATKLSVSVNGVNYGFFSPTRGVKQGDPLSPYLFILAAECLSRGLNKLIADRKIQPYKLGRGCGIYSHLGFADDLLIFINGDARSVKNFAKFLDLYQEGSGQLINFDKSSFYCSKRASHAFVDKMSGLLNIKWHSLPFIYLGAPIYQGINRTAYCHHLLRKIASFFWSNNGERRHHWVQFAKLCFPYKEGGLGIRSLATIQQSYSVKLWWNFHKNQSPWSRLMHSKYYRKGLMQFRQTDSCTWKRICHISLEASEIINVEDGTLSWRDTGSTEFQFSKAYELLRSRKSELLSFSMIWDSTIPVKY